MTAYNKLVQAAYTAIRNAENAVPDMYESDPAEFLHYRQETLAIVQSNLAVAEQQRIANLLTVAIDRQVPVGGPVFNHVAREQARDDALESLGLPPGGWDERIAAARLELQAAQMRAEADAER